MECYHKYTHTLQIKYGNRLKIIVDGMRSFTEYQQSGNFWQIFSLTNNKIINTMKAMKATLFNL